LASDKSSARWRSQCIITCTLERGMPVSREISRVDPCVYSLPSWLSTRSSTFSMFLSLYAPNAVCCCLVARQLYPSCGVFSRLSMLPSFQPLSGNSLSSLRAQYPFKRVHAGRRRDNVDRRSYLLFIMLITCQSLFKIEDEIVACVAGTGYLTISAAVQF